MRRLIVVAPGLIGPPGASSFTSQRPLFLRLAESGAVVKLLPDPPIETPEAAVLGLNPTKVSLKQGPLTVAALGVDPPDRSVHFHLSLMSTVDGVLRNPVHRGVPTPESRRIAEVSKRLNTRVLTVVSGADLDHGLVWEGGSVDLAAMPPPEAHGKPLVSVLPEGDGEGLLRRFVDDSVNLLDEEEFNHRRRDEGLEPLNTLWPWGQGFREPVPNLFFKRGEQALVLSGSLRLQGLARLVRFRHAERALVRNGLNANLPALRDLALENPLTILYLDTFDNLRMQERHEDMDWLVHQLEEVVLTPFVSRADTEEIRLSLVCPSRSEHGLALTYDSRQTVEVHVPFDERSLEERRLPTFTSWETIEEACSLPSSASQP